MKRKLFSILIVTVILTTYSSISNADLPDHILQGEWCGYFLGPNANVQTTIEMFTKTTGFVNSVGTYDSSSDQSFESEKNYVIYYPFFHRVYMLKYIPGFVKFRLSGYLIGNTIIGTAHIKWYVGDKERYLGRVKIIKIGPLT